MKPPKLIKKPNTAVPALLAKKKASVEKPVISIEMNTKTVIASVREVEKKLLENTKDPKIVLQKIVELTKHISESFEEQSKSVHVDALHFVVLKSMQRIFTQLSSIEQYSPNISFLSNKKLEKAKPQEKMTDIERNLLQIQKYYSIFVQWALDCLSREKAPTLQTAALDALMTFINQESTSKFLQRNNKQNSNSADALLLDTSKLSPRMDNEIFEQVVFHLILPQKTEELDTHFEEKYLSKFSDVRVLTLRNIRTRIGTELAEWQSKPNLKTLEERVAFTQSVFDLLQNVELEKTTTKFLMVGITPDSLLSETADEEVPEGTGLNLSSKSEVGAFYEWKTHRKAFTECWLAFLKLPLTQKIYKLVLTNMDDKVLPFFTKPVLLMDFLKHSYDVGGIISILALNGLFTLVAKHNLDYPDFFAKLYVLFDQQVLLVKYRVRFFQLADLFLSSSYLPAYLVAAFVKRLARLSLFAPAYGCMLAMVLMYKLLQLHPSVRVLIHRIPKELPKEILLIGQSASRYRDNSAKLEDCRGFDVYNFEEKDPAKCRALDSSLWELKILKQHYLPAVSRLVEIFEGDIDHRFVRMEEYIETSYNTLFHTEIQKQPKTNAIEFKLLGGLFNTKENEQDSFVRLWNFDSVGQIDKMED